MVVGVVDRILNSAFHELLLIPRCRPPLTALERLLAQSTNVPRQVDSN
jgi:hypothetical protein